MKPTLLTVLAIVSAFACGFFFDRWLHRPISAGGFHVTLTEQCFSDKPETCETPEAKQWARIPDAGVFPFNAGTCENYFICWGKS